VYERFAMVATHIRALSLLFLIGALGNDSLAAPALSIARLNNSVVISWPVSTMSFQLQESTGLSEPNGWSAVAQLPITNGDQVSVTVPMNGPRRFFRLNSQ
jgi:hypothetical protein